MGNIIMSFSIASRTADIRTTTIYTLYFDQEEKARKAVASACPTLTYAAQNSGDTEEEMQQLMQAVAQNHAVVTYSGRIAG